MEMGARVLDALGRADEALALARRYADRARSLDAAAFVAEMLWRRGDHAGAAGLLAPPGDRLGPWDEYVAPAFARAFAAGPPPAAGAAAAALVQRGVGVAAVEALALRLDREGHPAPALAAHEALTAPGMRGLALLAVRHGLRARATSRAEADRWLEATVAPASRGPIAMFAFGEGDDALVQTAAATAQVDGDHGPYLTLLRAASSLRGPADPALRASIAASLASPTHDYHRMARYLLGLDPLESMVALATTDERRSEAGFWIGFRALAEGRREEAADWYRFIARRGSEREGEVRWAMRALFEWSAAPVWLDAMGDPRPPGQQDGAPASEAAPPRRRHRRHGDRS